MFIRLVVAALPKSTKLRENSNSVIAVQGHPRSSTLVSIENAYLSLVVTLDVSRTVFEILTHKASSFFPVSPCLTTALGGGGATEFLEETYPTKKTRGISE